MNFFLKDGVFFRDLPSSRLQHTDNRHSLDRERIALGLHELQQPDAVLLQAGFQQQMFVAQLVRNLQQGHGGQLYLAHAVGVSFVSADDFFGREILQLVRWHLENLTGEAVVFHPALRTDFLLVQERIGYEGDDFENHADEVILLDHGSKMNVQDKNS